MIQTAARLLSLFLGLALMTMSSLLDETEEGQIQNRLEALWIRLSDVQSLALSKQARFVRAVTALTTPMFDRIFGPKLVSIQSVTVSVCFSMASLGAISLPGFPDVFPDTVQTFYIPVILLFLAGGLLPAILKNKLPRRLWFTSVIGLCLVAFAGMCAGSA